MSYQVDSVGWDCADAKLPRTANIVLSSAKEQYNSVPTISWMILMEEGVT